MPRYSTPFPTRFWKKVDRSGGPNACWPWLGTTNQQGYGICPTPGPGGSRLAHRVAYEMTNGFLPAGQCALHRCDNPPCCNPAHLWSGTRPDNSADMARKGRAGHAGGGPEGEANGAARLNPEKVVAIRAARARGRSLYRIADDFGVSRMTISKVVKRETWQHVP